MSTKKCKKKKKINTKKLLKNIKKKFKGFTLVELLAVIVILGIIMIIAIPSVLNSLETAQRKGFDEYVTKVYTATEKKYLEGVLTSSTKSCVMYNIGNDIGLASTGSFKGYTLVVKSDDINEYYITMWNENYMVYGLKYGNNFEFEPFTSEDDAKLSKANLAAVAGCSEFVDATTGETGEPASNPVTNDLDAPKQPTNLNDDDWPTIKDCAKKGTCPYDVGDEKEVDLGKYGKHRIRLVNTTPCNGETTQTACGVVFEFIDIIVAKGNSTNSNKGGWASSDFRTFVNNDIYNEMPTKLKNAIINTKVVSSYGKNDSAYSTVTDKLYLFSPEEIAGRNFFQNQYDNANGISRQLDYYRNLGINETNFSAAAKKYNRPYSSWWLRDSASWSDNGYFFVNPEGSISVYEAQRDYGLSPAFRIA